MPEIKIEDKPELRGFARAVIELSFTTLMWAFWIYMFLPLVTLILWAAGLHYAYRSLFEAAPLLQLWDMLVRVGWAALIILVVLRGWGYYNYYVFGRHNRRKQRPACTAAEMGRHFGLSEQEVQKLRGEKEIVWGYLYDDIKHGPGVDPVAHKEEVAAA